MLERCLDFSTKKNPITPGIKRVDQCTGIVQILRHSTDSCSEALSLSEDLRSLNMDITIEFQENFKPLLDAPRGRAPGES